MKCSAFNPTDYEKKKSKYEEFDKRESGSHLCHIKFFARWYGSASFHLIGSTNLSYVGVQNFICWYGFLAFKSDHRQ